MLHLVINLDRSPDRWNEIQKEFNKFDITPVRIAGVDGRQILGSQISDLTPPLNSLEKIEFPRKLTKEEVGCFLSHRKCWEYLINSDEDWALIAEDDIRFSPRASKYIKSSNWIPSDINLIRMIANASPQHHSVKKLFFQIDKDTQLIQPFYPPALVSACYLISKKFALDAFNCSGIIRQPVDEYLSAYRSSWAKTHPFFALNPAIATFSKTSTVTTIGKKRDYEKKNIFIQVHPKRIIDKVLYILQGVLYRKK